MIPVSISASALEAADQCLARYKAHSMDRAAGFGNPAAMLGTTLHGALERFTEPMERGDKSWDWNTLVKCYNESWFENFGDSNDKSGTWYKDGMDILVKWFNRYDQRSDIQDVTIVSREVKKNFPVPYIDSAGAKQVVPCNYIIDRLDQLDDDVFRVVDYKSQRSPLNPEDLKKKIQPRLYALAIQIEYPHARQIWVQYDFLRYERVSILFTRDDQKETWSYLKKALQRIINTPDANPPETLNENCRYCIKRFTCKTLQSNVRVGGVFSLSIDEMAELYYAMRSQVNALTSAAEEIEMQLMKHALEEDMLEFDTAGHVVKVTSRKTRQVDRDLMSNILGPDLMKDYGRLNVGDIDKLRADPRLNDAQKSMLDTAITFKHSDPSVKVTKKI